MITLAGFKEILTLCKGAHNNRDVKGWETLHKFDHMFN